MHNYSFSLNFETSEKFALEASDYIRAYDSEDKLMVFIRILVSDSDITVHFEIIVARYTAS